MSTITLRDVGLTLGRPLFQNLSFTIGGTDRFGLVAGNGAGKSSLLRCLVGTLEPSAGDITRARGLRVGHVEQDLPDRLLDLTLADAVRRAIPPEERDSNGWRVDLVLEELGATPDLMDRPLRAQSGGWQRLALLARAWVAEPDLLLLDEPTNHLDLGKIQRLEGWLTGPAAGTPMVIASHDRAFLDRVTTRTLFLRPERSRSYAHPYSTARALLADDDAAQQAKLAKDAKEAERLRRSYNELNNIGINSGRETAQKKAQQMKARVAAIEETLKPVERERSGAIRLASRDTHAKVLLAPKEVTVRRPDGGALFTIAKLELKQGDRALLLGRNGAGKTQLVRLLHRALTVPDSEPGVRVSPSVVLGYLDQQQSELPGDETPYDFINGRFRLGDQRSISLLGGAGFSLKQQREPIAKLSPGQRARLGLLALRLTEPSLYLLDEPTNHVDIPGQEALEAEILAQQATALIVSHDRRFAAAVATRWLLIERGKLVEVEGPERFYRAMAEES
jgi:ATPase subunit of ABC transporter with duplicated ATPase domains